MSVDKIILRAFLSTLAAIGALLLFMILSLCIVFPSTMMEFTYKMGMEKSSIHFAERAYRESDDVYYIAYATEVAIEEERSKKILSCGEKLLADAGFEGYCVKKGEGYKQFVLGQVCLAKYEREDKAAAIELAYSSLQGSFPENNALAALLVRAIEQEDKSSIESIQKKLITLSVEGEEKAYLDKALGAANEMLALMDEIN